MNVASFGLFLSSNGSSVESRTNISCGDSKNCLPFSDTLYCLYTLVKDGHLVMLNLMTTYSKLIACRSTLDYHPYELLLPNCFVPAEYVSVFSIRFWTSGSENVSFLLPLNHPINTSSFTPSLQVCGWPRSTMACIRRLKACLTLKSLRLWYHNWSNIHLCIATPTLPLRTY